MIDFWKVHNKPSQELFNILREEYKDNRDNLKEIDFYEDNYKNVPETRKKQLVGQLIIDLYNWS